MTPRQMGERLEKLRRGRGLSQLELAERLDTSRQAISKWETGASLPSTENLLALSALYGVTLDELVKGDGPAVPTAEVSPAAEAAPDRRQTPGEEERRHRRKRVFLAVVCGLAVLAVLLVLVISGIGGPSAYPGVR